jgi:hypothetical protein
MKTIFEHIKEDSRPIAYIARSVSGTWTINYKKYDNYTNVTLSSCQKLSDSEVEQIREMGILVFDFIKSENFKDTYDRMCDLHNFECQ